MQNDDYVSAELLHALISSIDRSAIARAKLAGLTSGISNWTAKKQTYKREITKLNVRMMAQKKMIAKLTTGEHMLNPAVLRTLWEQACGEAVAHYRNNGIQLTSDQIPYVPPETPDA